MKTKKGMGLGMVAGLVILIIVIVILFPLVDEMRAMIFSAGDSTACTASLFRGSGQCPIGNVRISNDKVELNSKKFMERGKTGTSLMAKSALARLLLSCLSKGGGYNSRAFSTENYVQKEAVCLECYHVNMEESAGEVRDFTEYLRDTKAKGSLSSKTYLEALTRDPEHLRAYMAYGKANGISPSQSGYIFRPKKEYTIFFIGVKKGHVSDLWGRALDAAEGDFLSAFFLNHDDYFAYIMDSNSFGDQNRKVCDRIVN